MNFVVIVGTSSSYRIGEYAGMALLLVASIWCLLRALRVLPRGATPAGGHDATSIPIQQAVGSAASLSPLGFSSAPNLQQSVREPMAKPRQSIRWSYAVTAVVLATLFIFSVVRTSHTSSPWDTGVGAQIKSGFISGCSQTESTTHCRCLFSHITSHPGYSTPHGLANLLTSLRAYVQTQNRSLLPPAWVATVTACSQVT